MTSLNGILSAPHAEDVSQADTIRATLSSWAAELAPFPHRWRRAARVAFVTAAGAGVMAAAQIANPLGLTLIVNFAAPEFAFGLATGVVFLIAAAAVQILTLVTVGALVDNPVAHICVFVAFTAVTTYLIYGVPKLGRIWLWIQIPAVTAFYMVLFNHQTLGWNSAQMFAGTAVAVATLWLFNNLIWPEPAASVLLQSLRATLERSRRRLGVLIAIFLGDMAPGEDRGVASKLAYHIALLHPATRNAKDVREPAELLAAVMVAERIENAMDGLCVAACTRAGTAYDDGEKKVLLEAAAALESALEEYIVKFSRSAAEYQAAGSLELFRARMAALPRSSDTIAAAYPLGEFAQRLIAIGELLKVDPSELPDHQEAAPPRAAPRPAFHLNRFLVRFCARHTVAMTVAFVAGLFDNNAAIHAALWLLMIGGPPSHGATAWKFTVRAIGASGALIFAALATIVLAPNFTTIPPYMAAMFVGVLLISYVGEGGGALSYLAVGATAFVIAFSGPGPRRDMVGSIWTIWGISLGMIIRAIVSVVSIERPNRTLAEEIERPLNALTELAPGGEQNLSIATAAEMDVIAGIKEMLSVATDAQLQGRTSGIDARVLVDSLDTMRRLAFALANLSIREPVAAHGTGDQTRDAFDAAVRSRLDCWLASIRAQLEPEQLTEAPLRTMVMSAAADNLGDALAPMKSAGANTDVAAREHVSALVSELEHLLALVSLSDQRGNGEGPMPRATD